MFVLPLAVMTRVLLAHMAANANRTVVVRMAVAAIKKLANAIANPVGLELCVQIAVPSVFGGSTALNHVIVTMVHPVIM